jgi:hypothetical protein
MRPSGSSPQSRPNSPVPDAWLPRGSHPVTNPGRRTRCEVLPCGALQHKHSKMRRTTVPVALKRRQIRQANPSKHPGPLASIKTPSSADDQILGQLGRDEINLINARVTSSVLRHTEQHDSLVGHIPNRRTSRPRWCWQDICPQDTATRHGQTSVSRCNQTHTAANSDEA